MDGPIKHSRPSTRTPMPAKRGRQHSVLVLGTRGLKARHRHLMRDLLRLLPHGVPGSKLDTSEDGLAGVVSACEDADCSAALLLDARDGQRLFMWAASCPNGPSAMFRVRNVHTVAELNLEAHRCAGVRNLLSFDASFETSANRKVIKALLVNALSVPRGAAKRVATASSGPSSSATEDGEDDGEGEEEEEEGEEEEEEQGEEEDDEPAAKVPRTEASSSSSATTVERVKHVLSFTWVDERIWLRVYRIGHDKIGEMEAIEIGPRLVLEPVRIIASAFGGAILHSQGQGSSQFELDGEDEMR